MGIGQLVGHSTIDYTKRVVGSANNLNFSDRPSVHLGVDPGVGAMPDGNLNEGFCSRREIPLARLRKCKKAFEGVNSPQGEHFIQHIKSSALLT